MTDADAEEWQPVSRASCPDSFKAVPAGLRLGPGIVGNAAGHWRGRIRNPSRRRHGAAKWLWIEQCDPRAVARYRSRGCRSVTGAPPPQWSLLTNHCDDPACLNPDHLDLIELPAPEYRPLDGGHYGWIVEADGTGETYGWIADPPDCAPCAKPAKRTPGTSKGVPTGERARRAKLTEDDVRIIRATANGDRRHGSKTSQRALAIRFGMSPTAIRRIVMRRAWAHVD